MTGTLESDTGDGFGVADAATARQASLGLDPAQPAHKRILAIVRILENRLRRMQDEHTGGESGGDGNGGDASSSEGTERCTHEREAVTERLRARVAELESALERAEKALAAEREARRAAGARAEASATADATAGAAADTTQSPEQAESEGKPVTVSAISAAGAGADDAAGAGDECHEPRETAGGEPPAGDAPGQGPHRLRREALLALQRADAAEFMMAQWRTAARAAQAAVAAMKRSSEGAERADADDDTSAPADAAGMAAADAESLEAEVTAALCEMVATAREAPGRALRVGLAAAGRAAARGADRVEGRAHANVACVAAAVGLPGTAEESARAAIDAFRRCGDAGARARVEAQFGADTRG